MVEDPDAQRRMDNFMKKRSLGKRNRGLVRTDAVQVVVSRRFLRKIGAVGGTKSRANMSRAQARRLGRKGADARAESLSPAQRSDIARRAVRARWAKRNGRAMAKDREHSSSIRGLGER
jgi:hypothetical protein